jgi:hypothetical protein
MEGTYLRQSCPFARSELRSDNDDDNVKASDGRCDVHVQPTESLELQSFVEILVKAGFRRPGWLQYPFHLFFAVFQDRPLLLRRLRSRLDMSWMSFWVVWAFCERSSFRSRSRMPSRWQFLIRPSFHADESLSRSVVRSVVCWPLNVVRCRGSECYSWYLGARSVRAEKRSSFCRVRSWDRLCCFDFTSLIRFSHVAFNL